MKGKFASRFLKPIGAIAAGILVSGAVEVVGVGHQAQAMADVSFLNADFVLAPAIDGEGQIQAHYSHRSHSSHSSHSSHESHSSHVSGY